MVKTIKQRDWAGPIAVDDSWDSAGVIARHRPYFYFRNEELYPCDNFGFRVPDGHVSISDKYQNAKGKRKFFCFGGSTTFGVYLPYNQSYPAYLEKESGVEVFNFGLMELDINANLYTLIDVLREGMRPDVVIFYDGINEKIAMRQAQRGQPFQTEFVQYEGFTELVRLTDIKGRLRDRLLRVLGRRPPPPASVSLDAARAAGLAQAEEYLAAQRLISDLCQGLGIQCLFFLQPTLWDVWDGANKERGIFLKTIYQHINSIGTEVIDLSSKVALRADMFYDICHLDSDGNAAVAKAIASEGGLLQ